VKPEISMPAVCFSSVSVLGLLCCSCSTEGCMNDRGVVLTDLAIKSNNKPQPNIRSDFYSRGTFYKKNSIGNVNFLAAELCKCELPES